MNKKFSTLVASLLLAGALGSPIWAAPVGTPTGWASTVELAAAQDADIEGVYLMSEAVSSVNQILVIREGKLALIPVTEALPSDKVDYVNVSAGTFKLRQGGQYLKVTTDAGDAAFNAAEAGATVFTTKSAGSNVVSITWVAPMTTDNTCYFQASDGALLSNVTTVGLSGGAAAIQFAAQKVADIDEIANLPTGYAELEEENFVSAAIWRSFVTSQTAAIKIDGTGLSSEALNTSSKITIESAGAGKYNLVIDGKKAHVDGTNVVVDASGTATAFSLVDLNDGADNSNRYLAYGEAGAMKIVTSASGAIGLSAYDGNGGLVANALPFKVSEIAAPAAFDDPTGYESVAFASVAEGKYYLATSATNFVNADFGASAITPVEWTLTKSGNGYILASSNGTLLVTNTSISVGTTGSSTALKVVEGENGNLYLTTLDNKVVQAASPAYAVAADATLAGDRPLNPLAIKLCKVKAETPSFTDAEPNDIVTDFAAQAVGKYNYITYGKNFLANKAGEATEDAKKAAMWKVTKVSEGLYKIADEDGNKVAFDADGTFDSKDGKYANFNYVNGKLSFTTNEGTYYVSSNGTVWSASTTEPQYDVVFYVSTLSADNNEGIKFLNGQLGNSFEVVFKEYNKDGDLEEMAVEANPFINGEIVAVPGRNFTVIDAAHENNPAQLAGKMFLKVAGSYPLTDAQLAGLTDAQKNQKQLDAFRASTFIAVGTSRYSSRITDVADNNFFEYVTVKGSAMISKFGSVLAESQWSTLNDEAYNALFREGHKLYGVTNYIENAEFVVENYQKDSYSDPMYLKAAKVYVLPTNNKNEDKDAALKDFEDVENLYVAVKTYNKVNYVGAYRESYDKVYFGTNNQVKQKDIVGIVNIVSRNYRTNGKVYATSDAFRYWKTSSDQTSNNAYSRIDKFEEGRVVLHNPEGQFYVKADGKNNFTFQNRESGEYLFGSVWNATDRVYEPITVTLKKVPGKDDVYAVGNAAKDTILIAEATVGNIFDGYADYNKETQLENKAYNILVKSGVTGVEDVYLAENHKNKHTIGASADAEDAVNWRLTKFTAPGNTESLYNDTIYVIRDNAVSYLSNGAYKLKKDTIAMFAYAMYNEANGEYLNYDGSTNGKAYYCNPDMVEGKASADAIRDLASKFILKEKNDGTYNLVVVYGNGRFNDGTDAEYYHAFGMSDTKAYLGVNDAKLNNESSIYKISDNDLFIIKEVDAPKYRSVATFDTIRIYKNDNEKIALYERGNFLGMQHLADVPNMAAAMFVDTAYVSNTNKPQYLLVVEPELIWHNADCNIPGHPAVDPTAVDTVKGRFLVNMVDSLNAWGDIHNNPYEWETYPKLAFKNGYHAANKLVIETAKPSAADVIDLSKNVDKIGTFAFRYIDRSQESFVIETGTKDSRGNAQTGYIKWLNGTPVVVPSIALAEVFNLDADEASDPTANEGIAATGVSVVAIDGAVIVKGAAGKTVAITNILGQTVANVVLSSDNETISAPAGVVVVAVEGEAAVKAIVK